MSYNRLRTGRVSITNQVYLLTSVTANRLPLFDDFQLARIVVAEMRRLEESGLVQSLAWVIMPDHLHWLIALADGNNLSIVAKMLKGRSASRINHYRGSSGAIWQPAFHDRALRQEEDLPSVARYVVANPLRAGLVSRLGDYPHWDAIWI